MPPSTSSGDIYEETLAVFDERATPFEPLTTPEIADTLGCGRRTVYKRLDKLVDRGEVETKKSGLALGYGGDSLLNSRRRLPGT